MDKQTPHKLYWLPNALTYLRIALIPLLIASILAIGFDKNNPLNAPILLLLLYMFCAFTDFFDGFLARKWGVSTDFGRMLDPIADKLMVAGCLIALMIVFGPVWYGIVPAITIIFRDIFVSGIREYAAQSQQALPPTKLAKWKTAAEMLAISLFIIVIGTRAVLPVSSLIPQVTHFATQAGVVFLWLAAILSVVTGIGYTKAAFKA